MFQARFHGRGGQGVVTAAELLALAAFDEGRWAQAFPVFGSERTGAPVAAFCRIDDREIRLREPIARPDAVIVQDPTLLRQVDVLQGLGAGGLLLLNTERPLTELGIHAPGERVVTVGATEIARRCLGRPLPNAALLGALAAVTGVVSLASVDAAIRQRFSGAAADGNATAARAAADAVGVVHA